MEEALARAKKEYQVAVAQERDAWKTYKSQGTCVYWHAYQRALERAELLRLAIAHIEYDILYGRE